MKYCWKLRLMMPFMDCLIAIKLAITGVIKVTHFHPATPPHINHLTILLCKTEFVPAQVPGMRVYSCDAPPSFSGWSPCFPI